MTRPAAMVLLTLAGACLLGLFLPRYRPMRVSGVVVDPQGASIPGARVGIPGGLSTFTDEFGLFHFPRWDSPPLIVASKTGFFNAFTRSNRSFLPLILRPIPTSDCSEYRWVDPRPGREAFSCGTCHRDQFEEWQSGAHGRPSRFADLFEGRDAFDGSAGWGLMKEYPEGAHVCASCHDPAPLESNRERRVSGIHCDFCHKVAGSSGGEIGLTHGRYGLELVRPTSGQLVFGPLGDTARPENSPREFLRDSQLCASCHEGIVFGVRVYETWSEWLASPAGRSGIACRECHMKPSGNLRNIAPGHGGIDRDPSSLSNHRFFDIDQQTMLRGALRLELALERTNDQVHVSTVVIARGVGHRLPTGWPDRNLELVVEAIDSAGRSLPPSGGPTLPLFAGSPGRAGLLFAKVLRDWEGQRPVPFWRASPEFDDSRLQPNEPRRAEFTFPAQAVRITARLVYRRFWPETMRTKGWPDEAWVIAEAIQ